MNEKITKILKIAAYTGLIAASVFSVVKGLKEKNKHDKKEKMLLIAKQLNSDIRNTERKKPYTLISISRPTEGLYHFV